MSLALQAAWTHVPVPIDGALSAPAWQYAPPYPLLLPRDSATRTPEEAAAARFLWDEEFLYVGIRLEDRDVVQEDDRDQQHHYSSGDVVEVFLKCSEPGMTQYWELYVTPQGRKTSFFYPSRGCLGLPSASKRMWGLETAARVQGTLNDWRDDDDGWSAEMAVPWSALAPDGELHGTKRAWQILVARYNYGRHLANIELSSTPRMPRAAWHDHEHWARLDLLKPELEKTPFFME